MNKTLKIILITILTICFFFSIAPFSTRGNGSSKIFIQADGAVDPPTAPIKQNGDTYVLTGDIYGASIIVEKDGVTVDGDGHTIQGNNVPLSAGVDLTFRKYVTVKGLKIMNFYFGILLNGSQYSTVIENTISSCTYIIVATGGKNNKIYHNNFLSSPNRVYGGVNQWDNGYPDGGNFWNDLYGEDHYLGPLQNINGSDGIIDQAFEMDEDNFDGYPLMGNFFSFKLEKQGETHSLYMVSNFRVSSVKWDSDKEEMTFYVDGDTNFKGFCLICVPHSLLNETDEILVNETAPQYVNYNLHNNEAYHWIYFSSDKLGKVRITSKTSGPEMPESPLMMITPPLTTIVLLSMLAIASAVIAIIIYRKHISKVP